MATVLAARDDLSGPPGPARISADEFLAMLDAGVFGDRKLELADGELVEVPLPGMTHAELQMLIGHLLMTTVPPDLFVVGELTVRLNPSRVRDLDAAVVLRSARKPGPAGPNAIALAIEIADSTLATDLHAKALDYAQAGIAHYWVVDPLAAVVHVQTDPQAGGYARRAVVRFGEPLAVPGGGAITIPPQPQA